MRTIPRQRPGSTRPGRLRNVITGALTAAVLAGSAVLTAGPAGAAGQDTINQITTISYAPNSFVIGNAYPGWTDYIQGNPEGGGNGINYRWGFLVGENFSFCAWVGDGTQTAGAAANDRCGTPQQQDTAHFISTFTNGTVSPGVSDGSPTSGTGAPGCPTASGPGTGYGNVEPWRSPATPGNPRDVASTDTLLWRYVTLDGAWVLVHDRNSDGSTTVPNWFYMPVGCLNLG